VKQFPPNAYGLYDMLGNVWEWTQDWYQPNTYETAEEKDPQGPTEGVARVLRGGGYDNAPRQLRVSERHSAVPGVGTAHIGFRCVHLDLSGAEPAK
jgi:formylglycine-generating enzyme